jgi:hypothetical protein
MTGRNTRKTPDVVDVTTELDQTKVAGAMVAMRADATAEQQENSADVFDLGRQVGALQFARLQQAFLAAGQISLFDEIKKFKKYKDLAIRDAAGNLATARNLEEFCVLVFGVPYRQMEEKSANLQALGRDAYDAAARIGLNRAQLRMVRTLPEPELLAIQKALVSNDKPEVMAIIEDLAASLATAREKVTEHEKEAVASQRVLADKDARITQLKKAVKRIQGEAPNEALAGLQKEANALMFEAQTAIRGGLRHALIALQNHDDESSVFAAGLVGQLQADLNALREEFDLPDVSGAADLALAKEVEEWAGPGAATPGKSK